MRKSGLYAALCALLVVGSGALVAAEGPVKTKHAIDLELQVTASESGEVGGGFKFWVVNGDAKGKIASESLQKLHLKLNPIAVNEQGRATGPAQIAGTRPSGD